MKAYQVTLLVVDTENIGQKGVEDALNFANYPNDCINPTGKKIVGREIGDWDDDHPLNKHDTWQAEYKRLFGDGIENAICIGASAIADNDVVSLESAVHEMIAALTSNDEGWVISDDPQTAMKKYCNE